MELSYKRKKKIFAVVIDAGLPEPSLSHKWHQSRHLRPLFPVFLSGRLREVLLFQNTMCWLNFGAIYASSEGSCESIYLWRLALAFVTWQCYKYHNLMLTLMQFWCHLCKQRRLWQSAAHLHWLAWAFVTVPKFSCTGTNGHLSHLCKQLLLWRVCTNNHSKCVQPSVCCIYVSRNALSVL